MKKCLRSIVLILSFIQFLLHYPALGADISGSSAPLNPEFETYGAAVASALFTSQSTASPTGYVPSPVDYSYLKDLPATSGLMQSMSTLPVSYDLRSLYRVTPVKNQNPGNTCWAFASMASLESNILSAFSETSDFSENNLKNTSGFDYGFDSGGNSDMSTAYFARWSGPVNEADDPYLPSSGVSPTGLTVRKHIQDVLIIPTVDIITLKQNIMQYGAAAVPLYYVDSSDNKTTHSYYYSGSTASNHMVAVVGWDDTFPKTNFLNTPPGNGAFIAKNSWGTTYGDQGFFHISYYDAVAGNTTAYVFNGAEPVTNYGRVYQYDPLGKTGTFGYRSPSAWFANLFTAQGNEVLTAVSFYAASPNTAYTIKVYLNVTNPPVQGAPVATKSGSIPVSGYHTLQLDAPVSLTAGHTFSVVVQITTPGFNFPIPMENPVSNYSSKATASPGQSFVTWDSGGTAGAWQDLTTAQYNANVCLKAFTQPALIPIPQTITGFTPLATVTFGVGPITLSATGGGSGNPVTFTVVSGPGLVSGTNDATLTITGVGAITVKASQAGAANYESAPDVTAVITVLPKALTITANNAARAYGVANPVNPGFTSSGLVGTDSVAGVTYTYAPTATVTASAGTTHSITPSAAVFGSGQIANYVITYLPGALTIAGKASQIITGFTPPATVTHGDGPITLAATGGGSGNPVTFAVVSGPGQVSGPNNATLTITGAGAITVKASQSGSVNYEPAPDVTAVITVLDKTAPTLLLSTPVDGSYTNNATLNVRGSAVDTGSGIKSVMVNSRSATLLTDGGFSTDITLATGPNIIAVIATDLVGNSSSVGRTIFYAEVPGDVNNEKTVNVFDALAVLQYAVGLYHPLDEVMFKFVADVAPLDVTGKPKGDGQVNVFDALAILRHAVGLDGW